MLYSLTDALAYNVLLVGALAACLQAQGINPDLLRRHLQSPDPDRFVTQEALDLVAGLMGRPAMEGRPEPAWHFIGRDIAERGVAQDPGRPRRSER
ncbi:hypothetical protein ACFQ8C_23630 [Streptomyces sp. NPDC056503]|uniref:hypothetical protein n=1 Tax=Streptomyces sp. NPDC056503 TaxID=3345842 RepID=UPI00367620E7